MLVLNGIYFGYGVFIVVQRSALLMQHVFVVLLVVIGVFECYGGRRVISLDLGVGVDIFRCFCL